MKGRPTGDPRRDAADVLLRVLDGRARSTDLLNETLAAYPADARDAGLLHELVMGVLRRRLALEAVLGRLVRRPLDRTRPEILEILMILAYSALFLGRIPPHARVHAAVEAARRVGGEPAARFVNAVGRGLERLLADGDPLAGLAPAVRASVPAWVDAAAHAADPEPWDDATYDALAGRSATTLRAHGGAAGRDALLGRLGELGIAAAPARWSPDGVVLEGGAPLRLPELVPRRAVPQDEASQLVVHALAPRDGERIADLCAGVGIKTSQVLGLAPGASVLAVDLDGRRLDRADALCRDAGPGRPERLAADARRLPDALAGTFDAVLLDAPCTGLGTLVRRPEVRYVRRPGDVDAAASLQGDLLAAAMRLVRPGGRLVYAVCSFAPAEGDAIVDRTLAASPGFAREPVPLDGPFVGADGALRTLPWRHGMDGFVAVRLRRAG